MDSTETADSGRVSPETVPEDPDQETDCGPSRPAPLERSDSSNFPSLDLPRLLLAPDYQFGLDQVGGLTRTRFQNMGRRTKERLRKLAGDKTPLNKPFSAQDLARFQRSLNKRLNKFDTAVQESLQLLATEKAFYAFAMALLPAGGFVIGKYPTYFPYLHTVLFALLMPVRFYTYFKLGYQYYLADLCYYVNVLLLLFLWVFPGLKLLFVLVFLLALGTLCFAVITWRNSLVLHLIEKTTSSIIHIMPPLTLFVLVHEMPPGYVAAHYPAVSKIENWNFVNGIITTSIYYTIWQVLYHYFITVRRREQIANGRVTSFTFLKQKQSKTALGRFVNLLPFTWMQVAAFTLIQFMYQILTMLPCPLWYTYKHACGAFVAVIFTWLAYNGATYYIEVFGKRFEREVKSLREEIDDLQQRLERHEGSSLSSDLTERFS